MSQNKKIGWIGIVVTAIIVIVLIVITNNNKSINFHIENFTSKIINPIQNALTYMKNKMEGNDKFFENIDELKNENEQLIQKNQAQENLLKELQIIKAENKLLKEYLKISEVYGEYEIILATIINKDITNLNSTLIINAGLAQGIEENMTVVATEGLVGHIISVTEKTAKVQVITDTKNTVSALISNTREAVMCRGVLEDENSIKATYIPTDANIAQGDKVETSGMGGIYPKGIEIGEITKVIDTYNIIDRYAIIQTYVDFSKLENVAVIKNIK